MVFNTKWRLFLCLAGSVFLTSLLLAWKQNSDIMDASIPADLRIVTYNIHHGAPHNSAEISLESIAAVVLKSEASLVAIQEMDRFTKRSGNVDQVAELARLLNMEAYFSKSIDHEGGEYGVALFSKYPLVATQRFDLPMAIAGEQRSLALAKVKLPDSKEFYFGSTHLDLNVPNRKAQAQRLKEIERSLDAPLMIGGDFNAVSKDEEMILLRESFSISCADAGCPFTSPAHNPRRAIDFFVYNSKFADMFRFKSSEAMVGEMASDHIPHVAIFEIVD